MAQLKTRFTVWMEPDTLQAAKARAVQDGIAVSEVLAAAAKRALIDTDRQSTDAKLLAAMERVFNLIQRIDRRRVYDQQVLKEMVGLLIRSFFNHIPAVPPKEKDAALISGKVRFNRFLDALAANLRSGESALNDLPVPEQSQKAEPVVAPPDALASQPPVAPTVEQATISPPESPAAVVSIPPAVHPTLQAEPDRVLPEPAAPATIEQLPKSPKPAPPRSKWSLFQ
jgi:hypothetical protein